MEQIREIPITSDEPFVHKLRKPKSTWVNPNQAEYHDLTTYAEILVSLYGVNGTVLFSTIAKTGYQLLTLVDDYTMSATITSDLLVLLGTGTVKMQGKTRTTDVLIGDGFLDRTIKEYVLFKIIASKL